MEDSTTRNAVLVTLVIQNAGQSIVITRSRIPDSRGQTYDASLAVFIQEAVKVCLSFAALLVVLHYRQSRKGWPYEILPKDSETLDIWDQDRQETIYDYLRDLLNSTRKEFWTREALMMMLPAGLYVVQNHLQLLAASNVDATSFAIFSQLKIITTAIFTVTLLGRSLNRKQWLGVFGVFCGVVLVQVAPESTSSGRSGSASNTSLQGLIYILTACILSGFAGVYTEKVLTRSSSSIFASSLQMSLCSMVPAVLPVLINAFRHSMHPGSNLASLLNGFGAWTWIAIMYNVWGGFTVALTMKVASSLAKSFATSVAVVVTVLFSIFWMHQSMAVLRIIGAMIVVTSVYTYSMSATLQGNYNLDAVNRDMSEVEPDREKPHREVEA